VNEVGHLHDLHSTFPASINTRKVKIMFCSDGAQPEERNLMGNIPQQAARKLASPTGFLLRNFRSDGAQPEERKLWSTWLKNARNFRSDGAQPEERKLFLYWLS
jgi:hypothetical protein